MRQSVRLDGVEALEIEDRLQEPRACRVAVVDRDEVGTERDRIGVVGPDHLGEGALDQIAVEGRAVEPVGDPVRYRILQAFVIEDIGVHEPGEGRLARDHPFSFVAQPRPERVERFDRAWRRVRNLDAHRASSLGWARTIACPSD